MSRTDIRAHERRWIAVVCAGYAAVAFVIGVLAIERRTYTFAGKSAEVAPWVISMELAIRYAATWAVLLLATRWVAARLRSDGWRDAAAVAVAAAAYGLAATIFLNSMSCFVVPWAPCVIDRQWFGFRLIAFPRWSIVSLSLIHAWSLALKVRHFAQDEIRANQLRTELVQAQMVILSIQLRPHFLFNTLQSIAALIHSDTRAATRMLGGLRELFQTSMDLPESSLVSLADELALLRLYTDIEAVRFGDRLEITVEADDLALRGAVPHLLLQPLVENSVVHAAARRGAGRVEITASVDAERSALTLVVRDNGPGIGKAAGVAGTGVGLSNTRARLETLYGPRHTLSIDERSADGMTIRIRLPYVVSGAAA